MEAVRQYYSPFDTSPPFECSLPTPNARRSVHQLAEQAAALGLGKRWTGGDYYQNCNRLLGDITATPSSKSVGDLAIFLITKGVKPEDLINLPEETGFPQSVIDLLSETWDNPKEDGPKLFKSYSW